MPRVVRAGAAGLALALSLATPCGAADAPDPVATASADKVQALYLEAVRLMTQDRHAEATAAFEHLIALSPQHAGAWLELAISHCTLGHPLEAEKLFREIEVRFAPSRGILEVIAEHRRRGCQPWRPKIAGGVALARGYDSNVNQGASNPVFVTGSGVDRIESLLSSDFLPKRDSYLQATLDYQRELSQQGTLVFGQARLRHYDMLSDQDTNAAVLGIDQRFTPGRWASHASFSASGVSLGGRMYQRQLQMQARSVPPLALPEAWVLTLSASLSETNYVSRTNFDARTGELGALLDYRGQQLAAQGALGRLVDHGVAGRLGGDRHGWYSSVVAQRTLGARLNGEFGWYLQQWQGQSVYSPGLIDVVREQSTQQLRAALAWPLAPRQSLQLEWRHVRNTENISLFQYNSHVLQLNWRWNGF